MKKRKNSVPRQSIRNKRIHTAPPGSSPGIFNISSDALTAKIFVTSYNKDTLIEKELSSVAEMKLQMESMPDCKHWFEIKGFGNQKLLEEVSKLFGIHFLEMEDVVNVYQRPKMEDHGDHIFIIIRMLTQSPEGTLNNDQLSVFTGNNFVLTIQEKYEDLFDPVRNRLRSVRGRIREGGTDYLTYAINDDVIDFYFPLLEKMGDRLDELEDAILDGTANDTMQLLQTYKRELIVFRRNAFAERDKVNDILRSPLKYFTDDTKVYLRDTYDHIIQALDLVDSYREIAASLMDIYLSTINNRMNKVMKVMAVFSAMFLPLTFIVGVYGMNFSRTDPVTNTEMPLNMPELYSPYGYIGVMIFIVLVISIEIWYFTRKGWMNRG